MGLIRETLKQGLESVLASSPSVSISGRLRRGRRLTLAYHNIVASEGKLGDASLHLPLQQFRSQLDLLQASDIDIVAVASPAPASNARPQVSITFDDACHGALEFGIAELASRNLPATVFVSPRLLGSPSPWWDRLSDRSIQAVPSSIRETALTELLGDGDRILAEASLRGWALRPTEPALRVAKEAELDSAMSLHPKLMLGSHGWSHKNLARLDGVELAEELTRSKEWLAERWPGRTIPWIAYPYGLSSEAVQMSARATGYSGGLMISGGWAARDNDAFATPRLNITPGFTDLGFRARVVGAWA